MSISAHAAWCESDGFLFARLAFDLGLARQRGRISCLGQRRNADPPGRGYAGSLFWPTECAKVNVCVCVMCACPCHNCVVWQRRVLATVRPTRTIV